MSKVIPITIFFLYFISSTEAQRLSSSQLDSLYCSFLLLRGQQSPTKIQSIGSTQTKCGFGITNKIKSIFNSFSPQQKVILKSLLDRPPTDTSIVSPGGFFRIHYDTAQATAPVYSMDSLAMALDSVYNFEVNYLGYPPPPSDDDAGGDNKYDVYVTPSLNAYGNTPNENEVSPGSNRFTSYMEIKNNYSNLSDTVFYHLDYRGAKGINAARVTVAHEFHHAIQMGNYILRYDLDGFFYELTSTSMEHFVYPNIPDYIHYLPNYFKNTDKSLSNNGRERDYALSIWNIFLKDSFGYNIIKRQWELMPQMRAVKAIAHSFTDFNTTLGEQLNKFGIWTYFTNYRAIPGSYFEDARFYPLILPVKTLELTSTAESFQLNSAPLSNNFVVWSISKNSDTLVSIITNADIDASIVNPDSSLPFNFSLYNFAQEGSVKLSNSYYVRFSTEKPALWNTGAILDNHAVEAGASVIQNANYVFPSPFNYKKNSYIYIPAKPDIYGYSNINIYTISMKLVYSIYQQVIYVYGQKVVIWNGLDNNHNKLSSGVYIYVTKSDNEIKKGKLVIFNE